MFATTQSLPYTSFKDMHMEKLKPFAPYYRNSFTEKEMEKAWKRLLKIYGENMSIFEFFDLIEHKHV